jgi:2-polyprenyl-3-methyl-5-hydroxy-6-metoxy-1,4-benzoquinol methylase
MGSLFARVVGDMAAMAGKGIANKAAAAASAVREARAGLSGRISHKAAYAREALAHFLGRVSGKYYWEDFVRVYPEPDDPLEHRNFLNHRKFYAFAAQFARGATVADVGCGSGYGSSLLKHAGAAAVWGSDASKHAIAFARENFGADAEFSVLGMTRMAAYRDGQFDLAICSEVLEHIKEYGKEDAGLEEMKRITKPGGIVVIGTPNSELLGDHGFHFGEMDALMKRHFGRYCIFENALVPDGPARALWERRRSAGQTGVLVTHAINLDETVLPHGGPIEVKIGAAPGVHFLGDLKIDTTLLHNTHSWAIVAIRDQLP